MKLLRKRFLKKIEYRWCFVTSDDNAEILANGLFTMNMIISKIVLIMISYVIMFIMV